MNENTTQPTAKKPQQPVDRSFYSGKLDDGGRRSSSPTTRQPPVAQKAWTSAKNPITGRSTQTPQLNNADNIKQSKIESLREGQRARITLNSGAEFEGIYAQNQADPSSFFLRMVQRRKGPGDMANGSAKREEPTMTFSRKDVSEARNTGGNVTNKDGKMQNGNRTGFRTDTAISKNRPGVERVLQPWVPDSGSEIDGSLERMSLNDSSQDGGKWDQFATNEKKFGVKTSYNENLYTTAINRNHPNYKERDAFAKRKEQEILGSAPTTSHVAEERVMDYSGGNDAKGDEEDKYSGVRRQDFPPLGGSRENKYTPPAKRAPTGAGQGSVAGAPVDPAIISSQLKGSQKKPMPQNSTESKAPKNVQNKSSAPKNVEAKTPEPKSEPKPEPKTDAKAEAKAAEVKSADKTTDSNKTDEPKTAASLRPAAAAGRAISPQTKPGAAAPSATSTVERDLVAHFRHFASREREKAKEARTSKVKADQRDKLQDLKKFGESFKLSTPVPSDLIPIIAKDPAKQKAIQEKALQNAEEIAKAKLTKEKDVETPAKQPAVKSGKDQAHAGNSTAPQATPEVRNASRSGAPQQTPVSANQNQRHPSNRPSYTPSGGYNNSYRDGRANQYGPQGRQAGGNLSSRLRAVESTRNPQQMAMPHALPNQRPPPTGPANLVGYNAQLPPLQMHMAHPKLNPNSHEFRPNAFAPAFNPNGGGPGNGSNSGLGMSNVEVPPQSTLAPGPLVRRKTKAVDVKKCNILAHIKTAAPPVGRNWDENEGLRPAYDTLPTWRQLKDDEAPDSTMHMTYTEYLEKMPYGGGSMATPNQPHAMMAHQYQLPLHMQQGAHNLAPRQSPHMPPMQMPGTQHGHMPHVSYAGGDDHRMMHSNSAQSYASPRMPQVPIGYPPSMGSPAQVPYQQGVMPPFMPSTPQMNNYRSFSNNPQYMPQQNSSPMTVPMIQGQFLPAPNQMVAGGPPMMYPGGHQQFVPGGAAAPQPIPGATGGYPSPGRPQAAMMSQQGSQQGQPMYGVSPSMQFQQPVFPSGHPGHMGMRGGYNGAGPQYGSSPQMHQHQYGGQHRNNNNNNYGGARHGQHQGGQQGHQMPMGPQGRQADAPEEGK
ncbi:hypothetical protein MCOR07_007026 [Pyricularia oryzae]|uniref:LsmAD domain-containing protein n=2 Tax=Pyricularia TaxID=48558 RepID=A0ABQ8NLI5_PYRGI|nr:hypothetical protein MCOR01_006018 [Pyricularia oryzae]KAI6297622.1 hypothetical protein MCOR33_006059 [Pyricularia grisea]KAI6284354.1 hypothetical protein MCOR26_001988 [Pyricularia oryzae]KAI6312928.1 hypothetical protein MCOR34_005403 [Pyricularia oryzae]KAI6320361.1 hypothetical protein MCOR29_005368 [Pyricularia oryzae]